MGFQVLGCVVYALAGCWARVLGFRGVQGIEGYQGA